MKKTIFSATVIVAMVGANFISCKKEELILPAQKNCSTADSAPSQNPENSVVVEDGRLSFRTISDFENAASSIAESDDFIARIDALEDFYSTKEKKASYKTTALEDTLIDDEFLAAVLDENYSVQIESHIYKLNFVDRKVFALSVKDKKEHLQDLLSENASNPKVREFSMEEDVLDLVKEGTVGGGTSNIPPAVITIICSESGVGSVSDSKTLAFGGSYNGGTLNIPTGYNMTGTAKYAKYGIYFTLFTELRAQNNSILGLWNTDLKIIFNAKWKPRCQQESSKNSSISGYDWKIKQTFHSSTKALHKPQISATFVHVTTNTYFGPVYINKNY